MSLYNLVNKVNPAAFFLLPMIENKHPDNWPRFRDCFATARHFELMNGIPLMVPVDEKEKPSNIYVLLRIGGGNRDSYEEQINELRKHPNFLSDEDDTFDSTFAHFVFSVPEKWKDDYEKVIANNFKDTSKEYKEMIINLFPKLNEMLTKLFGIS